ncbi:probable Csh5-chitin synthase 5 [Sporisorium reilianum SRZ2]|uniref:chitin synthase n=1 Tax=Sporisorium reilianum (strain SRZ2) TaxID=999809 RepID=E7A0E0_SPORE|nr:probable Csh5-chitin synthase 5 [Sporisorium reilianum SRZ2]
MNPFESPSEAGRPSAQGARPNRADGPPPLPPLTIPGGARPQHPFSPPQPHQHQLPLPPGYQPQPQSHPQPRPHQPFFSPPQAAMSPPLNNINSLAYPNNTGPQPNQQRPPGISFQEPQRMPAQRSGPSRDSVKSYADDKRSINDANSSSTALNQINSLDPESGFSAQNASFRRKKSLVRPDRERMDPNHRQWYYRNHAAHMDVMAASGGRVGYMPSTTGHLPQHGAAPHGSGMAGIVGPGGGLSGLGVAGPANVPPGGLGRAPPLRRGKSILGRDEDQVETGINVLKRGVSLRRNKSKSGGKASKEVPRDLGESKTSRIAPGPVGAWMIYCYILTICCPGPFLRVFGIRTPEQQRAWREKMGLIGIVTLIMSAVGFLTFGFTQTVCGTPPDRYTLGTIDVGSMTFNGYDYSFDRFVHPQVGPFGANTIYNRTNPIYSEPWSSGGQDGSLLFQKIGASCTGLISNRNGGGQPERYFDCTLVRQDGKGAYANNTMCHTGAIVSSFNDGAQPRNSIIRKRGQVSLNWNNVTDTTRNLAVFRGAVLDLNRLNNLTAGLTYPALYDVLKRRNDTWAGRDVTSSVMRQRLDNEFACLEQITRIGFIDSETIGCVASKVELYLSLVFIIGVVAIKFFMAVMFGWFISWRLGNYANETYEQRMKRAAEIEQWSDDIYRPAPAGYRPNARKHKSFLPTQSRFSVADPLSLKSGSRAPMPLSEKRMTRAGRLGVASPLGGSPPGSPSVAGGRSSASLAPAHSRRSSFSGSPAEGAMGACPFPLHHIVPQPGPDYRPFGFQLAHSICLVTAYSESFEGLRTTLDSLATTDYPNSHKLLLVIADGIVKGAGSDISTPDICLSMMKELVIPAEEVEGNSYVAIADGYKRHNMCKIYAGFYDYDDETVERSKQQRVPMILVAKCGTPLEADSAKPGNRGKRDSQVLLMAFMQKVMFDERMTAFEYEFFNSIWRVTGVSPDNYEIVLCVDADTKVFPDSLSRMVACMVEDPEIMGLCGETKIANKAETWVTMIQVFEYYISHHQTKAFEACFGGVTCLPGCFSAYRIKAPKGPHGYWVPILANPDIVEHYSENVVDTLHKKNLLLLGEDRYLTTLMLKTFPKRKMVFVPQAVCKTIVPDTFRILLSQRRRWINSTVHNLFELVMVNDLCGTFCFSMRFVVFMELTGTLVLPAAIAFTLYVVVQAFLPNVPTPTIPLILLALILGLPGILIVVTSRKIAYVGWMLIYLCSLPIWNFVLPLYAYWHMDDFSWGATRVVQGENKKDNHGDADGKFDPSHIVMKRWAEFERERRWKSGTHSRDSTYDVVQRTGSPERAASTRYSVVSSDTFHSNPSGQHDQFGRALPHATSSSASQFAPDASEASHSKSASGARARLDAVPLLELPAPLATDAKQRGGASPPGTVVVPRPRATSPSPLPHNSGHPALGSVNAFTPTQYGAHRLPAPPGAVTYEAYPHTDVADDEKRPMMGSASSSPDPEPRRYVGADVAVRHGSVSTEQRYPAVSESAYPMQAYTAEPETDASVWQSQHGSNPASPVQPNRSITRGFSLVDDGPVASAQGVRQVQRGARRTSQMPNAATSPPSGNRAGNLPPGAAPPSFD